MQPEAEATPTAKRGVSALTIIVILCAILVALMIVYPLARMIGDLFFRDGQFNTTGFEQVAAERGLGQVLINTVFFVVASSVIALCIGSLLAWIAERTDARIGWLADIVPLVPLLLPGLAGVIGWVFLLSPTAGFLNVALRWIGFGGSGATRGPLDIFTVGGMIFSASIFLAPYAHIVVSTALRNLDASMEEASRISGAGLVRTLIRISMPAVTPALISAVVLIITAAVGLFSIPAILGNTAKFKVLSYVMYSVVEREYPPRVAEAVVLATGVLFMLQAIIVLQWLGAGRRFETVGTKGLARARIPLGKWRIPAIALTILYVTCTTVLPLLALLVVSLVDFWSPTINWSQIGLQNYYAVLFENSTVLRALRNSVLLGAGVAVAGVTMATLLSYYLSRSGGALARAIDMVTVLPATLPHIILGVAFLVAFSGPPLPLYGTTTLLFIAYVAMFMPQAMQSAKFAFNQFSPELLEASRVFGASETRTFIRILIPLILPNALAGMLIVSVLTLTETNASIILAKITNPVIGPTLYNLWSDGLFPPVAALAMIICAVNIAIALCSTFLSRVVARRGGASV